MFKNLNRTAIIAHRGSKAYAPENTMAAFERAYDQKADAVEFDVKLTKDRKIIIFHDQTVERTTNGSGKVKDYTFEEIRKLDAGNHFSSQFTGEKIPSLEEVLHTFAERIICNIEITNYQTIGDGLAKEIVRLVKDLGMQERVFFSSFHPYNLFVVKRLLPEVPVAILSLPGKAGWLSRTWLFRWISPRIIHPYYTDVNMSFVKKQHGINRLVNVWTVNEREDMKKLISCGVDGIITDDPPAVWSAMEKK